jgi:hypothetical protein
MIEVKRFQSERTGKTFPTKAQAHADENQLDKKKLAILHRRIKTGKPWVPKIGDYIYVATSLYIDHGEDDVVGGLGQVTGIKPMMSGGDPNTLFVAVAQHPGDSRNWSQHLVNEQVELMKRFGTKFAYPDPDLGGGGYFDS